MDAPRVPWLVLISGLIVTVGCTVDYTYPTVRQPPEPEEPREPPQVVDHPAPPRETAADEESLNQTILGWIDRVDRAGQPARPATPATVRDPDVQHALDVELAPTSQAASQPGQQRQDIDKKDDTTEEPPPAAPAVSVPTSQPAHTAPPRVVAVTVHPVDAEPVQPAGRVETGVNSPAAAAGAPPALRDLLERLPPAVPGSFRAQLDRRLLSVIAGDYEGARRPLELVTAEQQQLATRFIDALIVLREAHAGDEAAAARAAADVLRELLAALQTVSELSIPRLKICRAVRGYGQYDAIEPPRFRAGQPNEFVLYCELRDFTSQQQDDGQFLTRFDLTTAILDRAGQTVLELRDTDLTDRCANRRHDCFIPRLVRLPATLATGQYVAKVTAVDKLGQKVAENRVSFEIAAER